MISKDTKLLLISPHPDDETLGCGGLIRKIKKAGGEVYVQIMTYGDEAQYGGYSEKSVREQELQDVMNYLEVDDYEVFFPGEEFHLKLDGIPEKTLLDKIEKNSRLSLNQLNPNMVGIPAENSTNVDHRVTYRAAFTALRPRPHHLKSFTPIVFTYDNLTYWNYQNFEANWFVNIDDEIDEKIHALSLYATQMRDDPHERSLDNIRRFHEVLGRAQGVNCVEQFYLNRLYHS